jgi:hypothetical protein
MNREITLLHKTDPEKRRTIADVLEQYSKILAAVALPAVIALGGWWIQRELGASSTRQEYVKIAVSILSAKSEPRENEEKLRTWATDLLNEYSPVRLPQDSKRALISGTAALPSEVRRALPIRVHFETRSGKVSTIEASARRLLESEGFTTDTRRPLGLALDHPRLTFNPDTREIAEIIGERLQTIGLESEMREDPRHPTGEVFVYIP